MRFTFCDCVWACASDFVTTLTNQVHIQCVAQRFDPITSSGMAIVQFFCCCHSIPHEPQDLHKPCINPIQWAALLACFEQSLLHSNQHCTKGQSQFSGRLMGHGAHLLSLIHYATLCVK